MRNEKYVAQSSKTRYGLVIPGVGPCFLEPEAYRIQGFSFKGKYKYMTFSNCANTYDHVNMLQGPLRALEGACARKGPEA